MPETSPKRSPINEPVARRAGEGLEREVYETHLAKWYTLVGASSALVAMATLGWIMYLLHRPGLHMYLTASALVMCGWSVIAIRGNWETVRRRLLGAKGERAVSDILDQLSRERGYYALHDVQISRGGKIVANIDHVLVGRAGVLVIETKSRMKPPKGRKAVISYNGERILMNGDPMDRDPLEQVRRNTADVYTMIREALGADVAHNVPMRPVVLFPGWEVVERSGAECWVLNSKRLFTWITTEESMLHDKHLNEQQMGRIANALRK